MTTAMSDPATDPHRPDEAAHHGGPTLPDLNIRALGRKAREHQLSANALLAVGAGLAVLASALLLWGGIVEGPLRAPLLLLAAALMPARLLVNRLSAVTLADGVSGSTNSSLRRWLHLGEAALLIAAGGFCAFGSRQDLGAVLGLAAAGLALAGGLRGSARPGFIYGLDPSLVLGATAAVSAFEPIWGWRGQSFLIGLTVIGAVLIVQLLNRRPAASSPPAGSV
jgi:hypothetical protein